MKLVSPASREPLFEQGGVDLVLDTVEVTHTGELFLAVIGVDGPETAAMGRAFHEELEAWGSGQRAAPTPQPGERVLALTFRIADDRGTTYRFERSAVGGTGRMFRGEWWFKPGVPDDAGELSIAVAGTEGQTRSLVFALLDDVESV